MFINYEFITFKGCSLFISGGDGDDDDDDDDDDGYVLVVQDRKNLLTQYTMD